jgi:hypothetical protein
MEDLGLDWFYCPSNCCLLRDLEKWFRKTKPIIFEDCEI